MPDSVLVLSVGFWSFSISLLQNEIVKNSNWLTNKIDTDNLNFFSTYFYEQSKKRPLMVIITHVRNINSFVYKRVVKDGIYKMCMGEKLILMFKIIKFKNLNF